MKDPEETGPIQQSQQLVAAESNNDSCATHEEPGKKLKRRRCHVVPEHLQPLLVKRSGELYGRAREMDALSAAHERRMKSNVRELILLTGPSGTGKTSLVRQTLRRNTNNKAGEYFVSGKFDQLRNPEPFAPFVIAFTELASLLTRTHVQQLQAEMDHEIDQALLLQMIPALDVILDEGSAASTPDATRNKHYADGDEADVVPAALLSDSSRQRFLVAVTKFLRLLVSACQINLTFFLDDLQWADRPSLELIHMLAESKHLPGLVFVGACRGNEVTESDDLSSMLRSLERIDVQISEVRVGNFSEEDVTRCVASMLQRTEEDCRVLGAMMHCQTEGNPMFLMTYMRNMFEFGAFVPDGDCYSWDQAKFEKGVGSKKLVDLLAIELTRIPDDRLYLLQVASCFGARFDERLLSFVAQSESSVNEHIDFLVEDGSFIRDRGQLCFCHDQFQAGCYKVIPEADCPDFHLNLARMLKTRMNEEELYAYIFIVASQVVRGAPQIESSKDKQEMALLCLQAARKASMLASFETARAYTDCGIDILGPDAFSENYSLALDLYNAGSEVAYCNGEIDKMDERVETALRNARNLDDKLQPYFTKMMALGSQNRLQEAIDTGFDLLRQLGEPAPSKMRMRNVIYEIAKTKWALRGKTANMLLNLPRMTDDHKFAALRIFDLLHLYVFFGRPEYIPFVVCRHLQLTLRSGLSVLSATSFASYGTLLCGGLGTMHEGYKYGALAIEMFEKMSSKRVSKQYLPRVYGMVYGVTSYWREPMAASLSPLLESHQVGQKTGDFEFAALSGLLYCGNAWFSGVPLARLKQEAIGFYDMMESYNQHTVQMLLSAMLQMVANLTGESTDPKALTGQYCNFADQRRLLTQTNNTTGRFNAEVCRITLSNVMGDFQSTLRIRQDMSEYERHSLMFAKLTASFNESVAIFALHRTTFDAKNRSRRLRKARKILKMMKSYAKVVPCNYLDRATFLEAEMDAAKGNIDGAIVLYKLAITMAAREGFIPQEALYNERMAVTLWNSMREDEARKFMKRARHLYEQWGCVLAVDRIDKMLDCRVWT